MAELPAGMVERCAKAFYRSRSFPRQLTDAMINEHFAWYYGGREHPDSCVHYSAVAICIEQATVALTAALGEEYVVVPLEPTEAMMQAGLYQASRDAEWEGVYSSYKDMLSAAGVGQQKVSGAD